MGSSRLPGKVLLPLEGHSVIEHVIRRVKAVVQIDECVVAIPAGAEDDLLSQKIDSCNCSQFRGSEWDVLDRFYQVAKSFSPLHVVRITADCPMIDAEIISQVISLHLSGRYSYSSNTASPTFPDGLDVEIFSFQMLKSAWQHATLPVEREHVTIWIRNHLADAEKGELKYPIDLSAKRWTLDRPEDYQFLQKVFSALYPQNPLFGMGDVLKVLEINPKWEEINAGIERNEAINPNE